jgi:RNA polymerase sigma-70 factor (ECF subfamily)
LQDVYVHLWRSAGDFDPRSNSPVAWMAAMARARALDAVAGKTADRMTHDRPEVQDLPAGEGPNEEERRLSVCLDRLEPDKRRALLRAYCYGMARDEIAEETDRPVATVKVWLRQSLAQLKDYLSQ